MRRNICTELFYLLGATAWFALSQFSNLPAAEGLRLLPESARALGKIGGKFATLDDPSVVRINPANLSYLDESKFMISTTLLHGETNFQSLTGTTEEMLSPWKYGGGLYFAGPVEGYPLSLGFGISAPYGIDMIWPENGAFAFVMPHEASLQSIALTPGVAVQVSDTLSLGISLDVTSNRLELTQNYPWALITSVPSTPSGTQVFTGEGWGVTPTFAMNWEPEPRHHVAIIGRLPMSVDFVGDYELSNIPGALSGVFVPQSRFESEIEFPGSIAAGYAFDVNERLTVGIDGEWLQNSTHDDLPINIGVNQGLLPSDSVVLDWKDSWNLGAGVEYDLTDQVALRAGYLYSESPIPDLTFTPVVPGNDRHIFSVGLGIKGERSSLDIGYLIGMFEDRSVRGNQVPAYDGEWEFEWHQLTISYTLLTNRIFGGFLGGSDRRNAEK